MTWYTIESRKGALAPKGLNDIWGPIRHPKIDHQNLSYMGIMKLVQMANE